MTGAFKLFKLLQILAWVYNNAREWSFRAQPLESPGFLFRDVCLHVLDLTSIFFLIEIDDIEFATLKQV